jgi:8-oxoguanine DNA glycosylase, N-terminal domain.
MRFFSQVLHVNGHLVHVKVSSEGTVDEPKLQIQLASDQPVTEQTKQSAKEAITYIFNLNLDLKAIYEQTQTDPVMHKIAQQLRGFKYPTTVHRL